MIDINISDVKKSFNNIYYVDTVNGSDSGNGTSVKPFKTMNTAVGVSATSGDAIFLKGKATETIDYKGKSLNIFGDYIKYGSQIYGGQRGNTSSTGGTIIFYGIYVYGPGGSGWSEGLCYMNAVFNNCIFYDASGYANVYGTYVYNNCLILGMAGPWSSTNYVSCAFTHGAVGGSSSYTNCSFNTTYDSTYKTIGSQTTGLYSGQYTWSNLTYSFLYDNIDKTIFNYTGSYQTYTIPMDGMYKLECWGAKGSYGGPGNSAGGNGAYASGVGKFKKGDVLYIYVGEFPNGKYTGGWNGGGASNLNRTEYMRVNSGTINNPGGGGGATDIRFLGANLNNRLIVAGGGAGGCNGGTLYGGAETSYGAYPAGQDYAGNGGYFGQGASNVSHWGTPTGGAGGGWYGGGSDTSGSSTYSSSSGGSSYALTKTSFKPTGYLIPESYALSYTKIIDGNSVMPSYYTGTIIGNDASGVAVISYFNLEDAEFAAHRTVLDYTGSYQTYIAPVDGIYKLECWGAAGSPGYGGAISGKGAYASGKVKLTKGETLYVYVGQYPNGAKAGGWNGGGSANINRGDQGGGGGATDIRVLGNSLYNRFIVAAGGGGGNGVCGGNGIIEAGGAETSIIPNIMHSTYNGSTYDFDFAAYQDHAGDGALFGIGATANVDARNAEAGGGGGWYGGGVLNAGTSWNTSSIASGGSSYVLTPTSYKPTGYLIPDKYILSDTKLIDGNSSMPIANSTSMQIGNPTNGRVQISYMEIGIDFTAQHYVILQDDKYYLPTQNNYDFVQKEFKSVDLDYLNNLNNFGSFIYDINELITNKIITNGETITPIKYFKNFQIVKIVIKYYASNDDEGYSMYHKIKTIPRTLIIKENNVKLQTKFNSVTLQNCTIELLDKFDSDNTLFHKLLNFDKSDGFKFLIKYQGRYYGKDLEPLDFYDSHDYVRKAIDISDLSKLDIKFNIFSLVIIFTKADASLGQVKYINQPKENKFTKLNDGDIAVRYNEDSIIAIPKSASDYLYLNITNGMTDDQTSDLEKF